MSRARYPWRVLAFDANGVIQVLEHSGGAFEEHVVQTWDKSDSRSLGVVAASLNDRSLAVGRRNGTVEVRDRLSGEIGPTIPPLTNESDPFVGLHLFTKQQPGSFGSLLSCTVQGNARIISFEVDNSSRTLLQWKVRENILCCKVDGSERVCLFGGKNEMNIWDLEYNVKSWPTKEHPIQNGKLWWTSATFLTRDNPHTFVVGTNNNQVHIYDARKKVDELSPCKIYDIESSCIKRLPNRDTAIQAIAEGEDGYTVYAGNDCGNLVSLDTRTGRVLGCFRGIDTLSIKSLAKHHELPVIASCGDDSCLSIWDTKRQKLQCRILVRPTIRVTNVIVDPNFFEKDGGKKGKSHKRFRTDAS